MSNTTVIFGTTKSADPVHQVFIGPAAALANAGPPSMHQGAAAVVASGRDRIAKTWEENKSYTYVKFDTNRLRNLGAVRADLLHGLVRSNVPLKGNGEIALYIAPR